MLQVSCSSRRSLWYLIIPAAIGDGSIHPARSKPAKSPREIGGRTRASFNTSKTTPEPIPQVPCSISTNIQTYLSHSPGNRRHNKMITCRGHLPPRSDLHNNSQDSLFVRFVLFRIMCNFFSCGSHLLGSYVTVRTRYIPSPLDHFPHHIPPAETLTETHRHSTPVSGKSPPPDSRRRSGGTPSYVASPLHRTSVVRLSTGDEMHKREERAKGSEKVLEGTN